MATLCYKGWSLVKEDYKLGGTMEGEYTSFSQVVVSLVKGMASTPMVEDHMQQQSHVKLTNIKKGAHWVG